MRSIDADIGGRNDCAARWEGMIPTGLVIDAEGTGEGAEGVGLERTRRGEHAPR